MKKKEQQMLSEDKNDWFISKAKQVHGDRYDYSKVEYINSKTKVCVICPKHGEFFVRPDIHLGGSICKKCQFENQKRLIFGKGYNDLLEESHTKAYKTWKYMLSRCYNENFKLKHHTYKDCTSCNEWLVFSNFKKWFDEHYVEGWQLDKDILFKGNKIYTPNTCCFVPQEINVLFTKRERLRGDLPIGVSRTNGIKNPYRAYISDNSKQKRIGVYETPEQAFDAYKKEKECLIKEIANKYKDKLNENVYNALINYKVEITD